jgi:hypothetical protein
MPRDIIGESFKPYVASQISIRQAVLGSFKERDADLLKYINNNTSWVRLSSGVNITYEKAKELGVTNFSGDLLAKKSVLFSARKFESYSVGNFKGDFTHGVGYDLQNPSYGYTPSIGLSGNDLKDLDIVKYGLVPPPGIVSAEIKSLNRGSLREATVEIVCHSLAQFRILEALYLKLKFSMFLEWGHTLWYDNKNTLRNDMPDWIHQGFLNGDYDQDKTLEILEQQRELYCGNYDGYLGYVRNFDWSLRQDGGYNITLKLISIGDVIESLKINTNYPGIQSTTESTEEAKNQPPVIASKNKSTINQILYSLRSEIDLQNGIINGFNDGGTNASLTASEIVRFTKTNAQYDLIAPNYFDPKEVTDWDKASNILVYQEAIKNRYYSLVTEEDGDAVQSDLYYIKLGTLLRIIESFLLKYDTSKSNENGGHKPIFYIDHDYETNLCLTIPNQGSTNPQVCLLKPSDNSAQGGGSGTASAKKTYTLYTYNLLGNGTNFWPDGNSFQAYVFTQPVVSREVSEDDIPYNTSKIKGVPTTVPNEDKPELIDSVIVPLAEGQTEATVQDANDWGSRYGFNKPLVIASEGEFEYNDAETIEVDETWFTTSWIQGASSTVDNAKNLSGLGDYFRVSGYPFLGKFMHIHVNLDFISTTLANNIDEEGKISLYTFLTQIMQGISDATGQVNTFEVVYDDLTNYFYIIDNNTLPGAGDYLGKDMTPTKLNVNLLTSNEGSFVKEVSIKSQLDNKFAATISIGAQANGNKVGENATALSKLNVGYEDRILKEKSSIIDVKTEDETSTDISGSISPQQAYTNNLTQYASTINKIQIGTITQDDITSGTEAVVDLFKYQLGYYTQQGNIGGVGFIPINLELTMKGLSGPRIYESYTINDEILPDNYKNNIQFITKGISHKISDNDWVTTLESLSGPKQSNLKSLGGEDFITGENTTPTPSPEDTSQNDSFANTSNCKRKTAYSELPIIPYVRTYISDDEAMRILKPNFSKEVALAVFAIMKNEQGEGDRFRGFNNNYGGVQTDSGRWSNSNVITGRLCLKDGGGEFREFASFNTAEESIKFKATKIKGFGIYIGGTPTRFDDNPWVDKKLPYVNAVSTTYGYEWIRSSAGIADGRWQQQPFLDKMAGFYKKAEQVYNRV